jgi:SpoVK/Ycf46/Vps4 family AAA+-type ATPase
MRKDKVEVASDQVMSALVAAHVQEELTLPEVAFGALDILSMWFHELEGEDRAALADELSHIAQRLEEARPFD